MFNPLRINFRDRSRHVESEEKVHHQLMPFGAPTRQPSPAWCQLQRTIGTSLNQPFSDQPVDDPQGRNVRDAESPGEVSVAAKTRRGNLLSDCLDVILRLFAGMVAANTAMRGCGGRQFPVWGGCFISSGLLAGQRKTPASG